MDGADVFLEVGVGGTGYTIVWTARIFTFAVRADTSLGQLLIDLFLNRIRSIVVGPDLPSRFTEQDPQWRELCQGSKHISDYLSFEPAAKETHYHMYSSAS